jgi:hypothetical protein
VFEKGPYVLNNDTETFSKGPPDPCGHRGPFKNKNLNSMNPVKFRQFGILFLFGLRKMASVFSGALSERAIENIGALFVV